MEDGMKTKKWLIIVGAAVFIAGTFSCGGDNYADVKKVLADGNKVLEAFLEDMGKAESADQVANILTDFNKAMGKLMPEMRQLEEKLPKYLRPESIAHEASIQFIDYQFDSRTSCLSTMDESHLSPTSAINIAPILAQDISKVLAGQSLEQ